MKKRFLFFAVAFVQLFNIVNAQYTSTTATRIRSDFDATWSSNTYPRLFGSQADMQRVKTLYASGDGIVKRSVDVIISEANSALTKSIPTWGLDAANLRVSSVHTIAKEFAPQLIIAYLITDDVKYAQRAWQVAKVLMTYNDWGVAVTSPYKDRHFLDAGIGAFNAAMLYDGLYHWMNPAQRDSLYQMTRKYVFIPVQAQYNGTAQRTWNWMSANNNWNGICNGGVAAACLTMFEHDRTLLSDVASRAINFLPNYINAFEPDGQSDEGLMYWSYGLMYTITALDIMKRVLSSTYGYGETNGMKKTGYFPVYTSGPVATINVGDDGVRSNRTNSMFWFSKHLNDSILAKFAYDLFVENGSNVSWFNLFHYLPELVNKGTELNIGRDNYVRGIDLYSFVERWKDRNALYLAVHAGDNKANHGHLDAGSFYIQGLGEYWAYGNLGSDSYTNTGYFDFGDKSNNDVTPTYSGSNYAPTSSQRWHFYRLRAEGKNTVVFNPDFRADQNPKEEAVYRGFINSSEKVGAGAINMNMIYSRDVNSFTRGFKLDRERRVITIHDNIAAKENKNIWWSMHTRANINLSADKKVATLNQNGKSMKFVLRSPDNATFQILNATYLEGRNFPLTTNSSNGNYRKLAVNLKDTKDVSIRIEAYPAADGDKEEVIDDFEAFSYVYAPVSSARIEYNIPNPSKDDVNGSDLVMRVSKLSGAAAEYGVKLSNKKVSAGLGAGQYRYLKVKIYKNSTASVKLRLDNSTTGTSAVYSSSKTPSKTAAWEEFTFDLLTDSSGADREGEGFDQISIMPEITDTPLIINYIDDLRLTSVIDNNPENIQFAQQKVQNLVFSARTDNQLKLNWNIVPGAVSYTVYKDKAVYQTVSDSTLLVQGLTQGTLYKFSVTAQNVHGQPSVSSDVINIPTRTKVLDIILVDNFETPWMPWTGTVAGATVTLDFANPLKTTVNNSDKCLRISRMAYTSNEAGVVLSRRDLFDLIQLPRYLHVKLYRGAVAGGVAIEFSDGQGGATVLRRNKPMNESDTLITLKWVDFVFDLAGTETENVYETLRIIPDLTASHSSSRNFFVDDVQFSSTGLPYTSIPAFTASDYAGKIIRNAAGYHYYSEAGTAAMIQVFDLSGRTVKMLIHNVSDVTTKLSGGLSAGVYIVIISSGNQQFSSRIIL
jgi:hypothetical protein